MPNGHCGVVVAPQGRTHYGLNATKFVQSFFFNIKCRNCRLTTKNLKSLLWNRRELIMQILTHNIINKKVDRHQNSTNKYHSISCSTATAKIGMCHQRKEVVNSLPFQRTLNKNLDYQYGWAILAEYRQLDTCLLDTHKHNFHFMLVKILPTYTANIYSGITVETGTL